MRNEVLMLEEVKVSHTLAERGKGLNIYRSERSRRTCRPSDTLLSQRNTRFSVYLLY